MNEKVSCQGLLDAVKRNRGNTTIAVLFLSPKALVLGARPKFGSFISPASCCLTGSHVCRGLGFCLKRKFMDLLLDWQSKGFFYTNKYLK